MKIIGSKRTLTEIRKEIERLEKLDTETTNRVRASYSIKTTKNEQTKNAEGSSPSTSKNR